MSMKRSMQNDSDDDFSADEEENHADKTELINDDVINNSNQSTTTDRRNCTKPVYHGCSITLGTSMLIVVAFSLQHSLSSDAIGDLLNLIAIHCLTPNIYVTTVYSFKKFFRNLQNQLIFHHYCTVCYCYLEDKSIAICPNCGQDFQNGQKAYFFEFPNCNCYRQLKISNLCQILQCQLQS